MTFDKIQTSIALMRHEHLYLRCEMMSLFRNESWHCFDATDKILHASSSRHTAMPLQDKGPQNVGTAAL